MSPSPASDGEATKPPPTDLGRELRQDPALLERLETRRLRAQSPATLDAADDALDVRTGAVDAILGAQPLDARELPARVADLAGAVADLLAAVVQADQKREGRYAVPLQSAPGMIDAFNTMGVRVPVDDLVEAWRTDAEPLASWRRILDGLTEQARRGVRSAAIGSTIHHDSPQSNQAPIVSLLAHVLSLVVWLVSRPVENGPSGAG
jgi:hypothetical protein